MGTKRGIVGARATLAIGLVAVTAVVVACAPPPSSNPGPTTTTTTSTTMPWSDPTGVWTNVNLNCSVNVLGVNYSFPQPASVNIEGPESVATGETFDMMVAPGPFAIPASVQGISLSSMSNVTIRFPLSPNVTFVDSVMSAGINSGPGYPSVRVVGTDLVYRIPGPFVPGSTVQMPKVRLTLTATGAAGSAIDVRMKTLTATATSAGISVPATCVGSPNPLFWSIAITPA